MSGQIRIQRICHNFIVLSISNLVVHQTADTAVISRRIVRIWIMVFNGYKMINGSRDSDVCMYCVGEHKGAYTLKITVYYHTATK